MCLPCWPFAAVFVEEKPKKEQKNVIYYDQNLQMWVRLSTATNGKKTKTAIPQPTIFAQPTPVVQQPQFIPQAMYPMQTMAMPQAQAAPQFYTMPGAYSPYAQPAFGSIGYTGNEMLFNNIAQAQDSEMDKPQEMKPADDDPLRIYWVREKDGTYTQRNRVTIDSGDLGEIRWYCEGGRFYAVRMSDG